MITRAGTAMFALLAAALGFTALADVTLHGGLTLIDPRLLGALAILGTGFLLFGLITTRSRADDFSGRAARLTTLTGELEAFIAALETANAKLNASEARYKGLVDAQGDAILRHAPDGRVTYANKSFFALFGARPEEVIGQAFQPESHPDSPPLVFGRLAGHETGHERVRYDQHVRTVVGYRWFAWEDYAIRDADGRLVEIQSVGRDITERKQLEAALTEARDKAEEGSRAKSRFLATMSHEIRTPMNGVLGMARLLLETPLAADQKSYAGAIRQSGLALLSLIHDILDFSKIESGALMLEPGEVALRSLIEEVNELLAPRAHGKGIEIAAAVAADVPAVLQADGVRLRQILTNLVGNAIKFTETGGVMVSATVERVTEKNSAAMLCIAVRDTGIGVPEENRETIFAEFVQADSSQARRFEGTGLGLAISKRLVEAMGGTIGMIPAEGEGSVFWFTLPLDEMAAHERGPSIGPPVRIGLLSASPVLRAALRLQLAAAGMEMVELPSLQAAAHEPNKCAAFLLDAGMGENAALLDVRAIGIPAVALLPVQGRAQLTALDAKGFAGYLVKPVRQEALVTRLAALAAGERQSDVEEAPRPVARRAATSLSVLLAEDNPVNALLARELLRRRGHSVEEVATGEGAVTACAARRFDLVVMDVHMPGLDGIEAARRIRAAERAVKAPPTAILALTADVLETGRRACLEAGMNGFLAKPVDPDELDAVLASLNAPAAATAG